MTDRVEELRRAAQARDNATLRRAKDALQALVASGTPVTFARLAKAAKVSRSCLYSQDELRAEVQRHRGPGPAKPQSRPREIARLRAENRALDDQLARRLGAKRADNVTQP